MAGYISDDTRKVTTHRLVEMKQRGEKISMLTAYDYTMAQIVDGAGMDVILVGDSASNVMAGNVTTLPITLDQMIYHAKSVVRGVKRAMVVVDMPFGSYQGNEMEGLASAIRIMKESHADALKLEGGEEIIDTVKRIVCAGIPVMGHLGLMPQSINKYGTYTVRAKDEAEADKLIRDAHLLEEAGCFAIVLEKIPATLAERVASELTIPIIGIGAGGHVDGQVLVIQDMLGMNNGFRPRFLRRYADLYTVMTDAISRYVSDVKNCYFPNEKICVANLLLFISLYVLFPVLSVEMADRLGVPAAQTGVIFLFFTLGMFLIGPFHAYLVDAYKRKYVCMFAAALMVVATIGYAFVTNFTELILLSTVQGLAFGIGTTAGITLAIDITNSTLRSAGNVSFSWTARLGMLLGIILGVWLYQSHSFQNLLTVSVITGAVGILMLSGVYVPFRAPIVTKLYSFDRFLLLRGWVPAINLILITFVPGLLIPMVHPFLNDFVLGNVGIPVPFFVGTTLGYIISLFIARLFFFKEKTLRLVIIGIGLEMVAMSLLNTDLSIGISSVLLGLGLGLTMPEFLMIFVKLSHHCQRGTANTTHLLASEVGISLGIATACYMELDTDKMLHTGQMVASIALLFFVLVTYPYYIKKKVR